MPRASAVSRVARRYSTSPPAASRREAAVRARAPIATRRETAVHTGCGGGSAPRAEPVAPCRPSVLLRNQQLVVLLAEMLQGTLHHGHRAVDEIAASAARENATQVLERFEIRAHAAAGVDAVEQ